MGPMRSGVLSKIFFFLIQFFFSQGLPGTPTRRGRVPGMP
jgi:hypothetical protein